MGIVLLEYAGQQAYASSMWLFKFQQIQIKLMKNQ